MFLTEIKQGSVLHVSKLDSQSLVLSELMRPELELEELECVPAQWPAVDLGSYSVVVEGARPWGPGNGCSAFVLE